MCSGNHYHGNQQAQQNLNCASFWFNRLWKNLSGSTLTFTLLGHLVSSSLCIGITTDALSHCLPCWPLSMAVEDHPVSPSSLGQQTGPTKWRCFPSHAVPRNLGLCVMAPFTYGHCCAVQPWAAGPTIMHPGLGIKEEKGLQFLPEWHRAGNYWWAFMLHPLDICKAILYNK